MHKKFAIGSKGSASAKEMSELDSSSEIGTEVNLAC